LRIVLFVGCFESLGKRRCASAEVDTLKQRNANLLYATACAFAYSTTILDAAARLESIKVNADDYECISALPMSVVIDVDQENRQRNAIALRLVPGSFNDLPATIWLRNTDKALAGALIRCTAIV